jgi:hypothetical protein
MPNSIHVVLQAVSHESATGGKAYTAGAEAHVDFATFAARLKSCPVTKQAYESYKAAL